MYSLFLLSSFFFGWQVFANWLIEGRVGMLFPAPRKEEEQVRVSVIPFDHAVTMEKLKSCEKSVQQLEWEIETLRETIDDKDKLIGILELQVK